MGDVGIGTRLRAIVGLTVAQLRYYRVRTALAIAGVALAVLLMVVLTGLGYGLSTTGDQAISWIGADLWVAGGPVTVTPGGVGGVENPIQDSHGLAGRIETHDGVETAQPLAFQSVYVSTDGEEFDTIIGVGGLSDGEQINARDQEAFEERFTRRDTHYANGTYEGPMTHEVVIDPRTAEHYNLSVGETLYIGGTYETARNNQFEVVGISTTFSTFLGAPTVAMHLSELQELSGTTGTDRAAIVGVATTGDADTQAVKEALKQDLADEYTVRTNNEQVRAIIGDQAAVVAGALALVVLALVTGVLLVVNVLALLVYQQREQLGALKAAGVSGSSLVGMVFGQGIAIGLLGGLIGLAVAPPLITVVNEFAASLSGFPNLIKTPLWLLGLGLGLALLMSSTGAAVAGRRVARLSPLEHLRR